MNRRAKSINKSLVFGSKPSSTKTQPKFITKGNDDIIVIEKHDGNYELNRVALRETLRDLKTSANLSIKQLSPTQSASFNSVVESLRVLYSSPAHYELILTDIRQVFGDIPEMKPGTVASFFLGCFNDDKFSGPLGCSPKCVGSLPPTEGTPGYIDCDDLVLLYNEGNLNSLNEKSSKHAYIHVDHNFNGFSQNNIKHLKDAGIEHVSIVYGNQNGTYREITGSQLVDQLPLVNNEVNKQETPIENNGTATGAGVVVVIIIIIIILILLYLFARNTNVSYF